MIFRAFGVVPESVVDGPGVRLAVFFQGCLHHCKGCQNPDSWTMYGGERKDTEEIKKLLVGDPLVTGLTLSGGEPFLQPGAALELAKFAKSRGYSVWCYTGYRFEDILEWEDNRRELLKNIDVLVDGEFHEDEMSLDIPWRGSKNQRLVDVQKTMKSLVYDEDIGEYKYEFCLLEPGKDS